jgi:hypothetical protein
VEEIQMREVHFWVWRLRRTLSLLTALKMRFYQRLDYRLLNTLKRLTSLKSKKWKLPINKIFLTSEMMKGPMLRKALIALQKS